MRIGRMIAAGTMAVGAYRAYKELKADDTPKRRGGRSTRSRSRHHGRQQSGWFGTPFSIRH